MTLAEAMSEWTDSDQAQFELGRALGLFESASFPHVKSVFWTDNPVGNGLRAALLALVDGLILEHRDEPDDQFRWSPRARSSL